MAATSQPTRAAATVSQLSCFSSVSRMKLLHRPSFLPLLPSRPSRVSIVMSLGEGGEGECNSNYTTDQSKPNFDNNEQVSVEKREGDLLKVYGSAKIHDFCLGIPYGGFVFSGGLLGFIFSRNPTALGTGVLFGGALLALSTFSLKVWRKGNSSLPFVFGQAVLSGALFWKSLQAYLLTKKLIPSGFYAFISVAMLCFYSYVMISGGNPPPKKLQTSATVSS